MDRRRAITALICLGGLRLAHAQKVRRIGFLAARSRSTASRPDQAYDAFVQGMRELGYVEGKNLTIEWRFADEHYDRLPQLAKELVALKIEVLVTHVSAGVLAGQRASSSVPIVVTAVADPVALGAAQSLGRPGKNVTGFTNGSVDITAKQMEFLTELRPKLSKIAVMINPKSVVYGSILTSAERSAAAINASVIPVMAANRKEIEAGLAAAKHRGAEVLLIPSDAVFTAERQFIANQALANRLPALAGNPALASAGVLLSYGPNVIDQYRRSAVQVDKILKGAKAGDLPFEQPSKFDLTVNLKTAKSLGISFPKQLLQRADNVIQ